MRFLSLILSSVPNEMKRNLGLLFLCAIVMALMLQIKFHLRYCQLHVSIDKTLRLFCLLVTWCRYGCVCECFWFVYALWYREMSFTLLWMKVFQWADRHIEVDCHVVHYYFKNKGVISLLHSTTRFKFLLSKLLDVHVIVSLSGNVRWGGSKSTWPFTCIRLLRFSCIRFLCWLWSISPKNSNKNKN